VLHRLERIYKESINDDDPQLLAGLHDGQHADRAGGLSYAIDIALEHGNRPRIFEDPTLMRRSRKKQAKEKKEQKREDDRQGARTLES